MTDYRILKSEPTAHTSIEVFAGGGGLALGLEHAGFQGQAFVEKDKAAVATLRQNRPDWNVIHADIKEVDFTPYQGKVDLVSGGFPCQSFSYGGEKRGFEDTRGTLFFEFARTVQEVMPKIALGENVRGLISNDEGRTMSRIIQVLSELGYTVEFQLLKAHYFDVPQKRERVFILAVRNDLAQEPLFPIGRDSSPTLRQALANVPDSPGMSYSEAKARVLALVPPGGNWRDLPDDVQREYMGKNYFLKATGGQTGVARRLGWDEPCVTLTKSPAQKQTDRCHPDETRPLTVREYARIQTFPDEWQFMGAVNDQYAQIGNAVPVNLAYHMGRQILTKYFGQPALEQVGEAKSYQLSLF